MKLCGVSKCIKSFNNFELTSHPTARLHELCLRNALLDQNSSFHNSGFFASESHTGGSRDTARENQRAGIHISSQTSPLISEVTFRFPLFFSSAKPDALALSFEEVLFESNHKAS